MKKKHIAIFLIGVAIDQIVKFIVSQQMSLYDSIDVIKGFFSITYVQNTGAAWSMFEGKMLFFYIVSIVAFIAMVYFYKQTDDHEKFMKLGIVFMMAGTVGNFIDRLVHEYVVDFLSFRIFGYPFPVFNVADILLTCGVLLLIVEMLKEQIGMARK